MSKYNFMPDNIPANDTNKLFKVFTNLLLNKISYFYQPINVRVCKKSNYTLKIELYER